MNLSKTIRIPKSEIPAHLTIESNGDTLPLAYLKGRNASAVFSVVDSDGDIIKHAHRWLHHLSASIGISVSEKTVEQYGNSVRYLCNWIELEKPYKNLKVNETLEVLSRKDITNWHNHSKDFRNTGNTTLHAREVAVKLFLTWLTTLDGGKHRGLINSPWGRDNNLPYVIKKGAPRSPKHITSDEIISILKSLHSECERCMFHTQYDTGLRISELLSLRSGDLPPQSMYQDQNFEFVPLYIQGSKGRAGQAKERISVISRAVLNRIRKYHSTLEYRTAAAWRINDPDKPVFLTSNGLKWSVRNAQKQFKAAVRRSGVSDDFSSHWMRHGTAFSVLTSNIGKDYQDKILTIKSMLGHANVRTTEIYTQISPAILSKLNTEGQKQNRFAEAGRIRSETYLPPLKHQEKRGKYDR